MISVPFASGVLRRLGQRSRESFWSLFVEPFQCLECASLDRVTRLVSSTPDVVSLVLCGLTTPFLEDRDDVSCSPLLWYSALVNALLEDDG